MSEKYNPEQVVNEAIWWADTVLDEGELTSPEERDELLRKLYTAVAISNSEAARERIKYIEERYGKTGGTKT